MGFIEPQEGTRADARSQAFFCPVPNGSCTERIVVKLGLNQSSGHGVPGSQGSEVWALPGIGPVTEKFDCSGMQGAAPL